MPFVFFSFSAHYAVLYHVLGFVVGSLISSLFIYSADGLFLIPGNFSLDMREWTFSFSRWAFSDESISLSASSCGTMLRSSVSLVVINRLERRSPTSFFVRLRSVRTSRLLASFLTSSARYRVVIWEACVRADQLLYNYLKYSHLSIFWFRWVLAPITIS